MVVFSRTLCNYVYLGSHILRVLNITNEISTVVWKNVLYIVNIRLIAILLYRSIDNIMVTVGVLLCSVVNNLSGILIIIFIRINLCRLSFKDTSIEIIWLSLR